MQSNARMLASRGRAAIGEVVMSHHGHDWGFMGGVGRLPALERARRRRLESHRRGIVQEADV